MNRAHSAGINYDSPAATPWLKGSAILQDTADGVDANIIAIPAAAKSVHLMDFKMRFADDIRHVSTGHGVNARPTATYSSEHEHGLI